MTENEKFEQISAEYELKFGEPFPFWYVHVTTAEYIERIEKCISNNKPYDIGFIDPEADW